MTSKKKLALIYLSGFLLAVHYASVVYLNSSLLKQYVSDEAINILYIIGSFASIATLFFAPLFFKKIGNKVTFLIFIAAEILSVFGIGSTSLGFIILLLFLTHQAAESLMYFCLDIALEEETKNEGTTGGLRGIFFTVQNVAWVFAPLLLSLLVTGSDFSKVYFLSGIALIPMFIIVAFFFKNNVFDESRESKIPFIIASLLKGGDKTRIVFIQFILNFFYAWMAIYLPLLLSNEIGFAWEKIGIILSIMLVPFLLFELPAGFLADKKFGEKEMLIIGISIMTASTFAIPIIKTQNFLLWAAILFTTRVGASLVEIGSETYFFKHVKAHDTGLISIFRMARPLSFLLVPIATIPIVMNYSYSESFAFLSGITLIGLFLIPKVDTR